jgi:hypothetical protein
VKLLSKALAYGLIALGLSQTIGFITGISWLRGLGIASTASPLPLVFTQFRGVETFAQDYRLEILTRNGEHIDVPITPALYSKLSGPYKRRNVYGAVISYGPALTERHEKHLVNTVLTYGFCNNGPLATEFGVAAPVHEARVHIAANTAGQPRRWTLSVRCSS